MTTDQVNALKDEGNDLFRKQEFLKAAASYTKAIKAAGKSTDFDLAPVYSNRSAAFLKLNKVKQALQDAEMCIQLKPDWQKSHFRKACACEASSDNPGALESFKKALELDAENKEIEARIKGLENKINGKSDFKFKANNPPKKMPKEPEIAPVSAEAAAEYQAWMKTAGDTTLPAVDRMRAVNNVGNFLNEHLQAALASKPGDKPWFFEDPAVVAMMNAGLVETMLGVVVHSVCYIISVEQAAGQGEEAAAAAAAAAEIAGASTGVMHNLLHPVLRAWQTRTVKMQLLGAVMKVVAMPGTPITMKEGAELKPSQEMSNFLALVGQVMGKQEAFEALIAHDLLMRCRLMLLRALENVRRGEDKKEWGEKVQQSAQTLVLLQRCRAAGGWEAVMDKLCTTEGATAFRKEVQSLTEQHEILTGSFQKFGFQASVGI